jgi:hypothetical protein
MGYDTKKETPLNHRVKTLGARFNENTEKNKEREGKKMTIVSVKIQSKFKPISSQHLHCASGH